MELQSAERQEGLTAPMRAGSLRMTNDDFDEKALARVVEGDLESLGELFDRHAPAMLGVAIRVLRDRGDAEDLVHDVFLEVSRKASSYSRERGRVRAWLMMRTRSRAIDRLRSLEVARRHGMAAEAAQSVADGRRPQERDADARRTRAALATLSPEQLVVVELAYFQGLTLSEIAEQRSLPIGTVKSRLAAALVVLRKSLAGDRGEESREQRHEV